VILPINGGQPEPTATVLLIQTLAMLALWSVACTGNAIIAFDVIALGALVIVVIDLAICLTFRVPWWLFGHGYDFQKCQQGY
jgi:hypothetical protein